MSAFFIFHCGCRKINKNQGKRDKEIDALKYIQSGMIKNIPVIFQAASLLAALTHPGHIVIYAPGDSLLCRRDAT
ncbi:hypothetical protein C5468_04965 [Photorhabdus luminescens subsp. mexicana]|uniref:Uncharacterized protein n=1 Tax=Photorhabdus luminescens subsp. mexicana TaxID=2100167 RepID=A0A4R4JJP9_PHOLU|nr:hypothetical protein C5468_04965 [Photorhabdus luminescens subsp. mexicana]